MTIISFVICMHVLPRSSALTHLKVIIRLCPHRKNIRSQKAHIGGRFGNTPQAGADRNSPGCLQLHWRAGYGWSWREISSISQPKEGSRSLLPRVSLDWSIHNTASPYQHVGICTTKQECCMVSLTNLVTNCNHTALWSLFNWGQTICLRDGKEGKRDWAGFFLDLSKKGQKTNGKIKCPFIFYFF